MNQNGKLLTVKNVENMSIEEILTTNGFKMVGKDLVRLDDTKISFLAATCSGSTSRLVGQTVTVGATPKNGSPPYTVVFTKNGSPFKTFPTVPENANVSQVYTLVAGDVGTQTFACTITDSCATGAKVVTETCSAITVNLSCNIPVVNFTLS